MRSRHLVGGLFALGAALLFGSAGRAQDEEQEAPPSAAPPPGHPGQAGGGGGHGGGANAIFEPPPDTEQEDERLPAGSLEISILDADNRPIPGVGVTLGIIHQSVARGESREHKAGTSNDVGILAFDHLATGSGIAYRVSVAREGATFAATPFQLPLGKGIRVALHVYPVTRDLGEALVVMQVIVYAEMKDDRVQLQEAVTLYNMGRTAWVPQEIVIGLPEEFTALTAEQQMSDIGVDPVDKRGARIHGTFAPGRHDVEFRWQLPYAGDSTVKFTEGLPPHVAVARVISAASHGMRLVVEGFPEAEARTDNQGQRLLVTERQLRRDDPPLTSLRVELRDLPTEGPQRYIATGLSGVMVLAGLGLAGGARTRAKGAGKSPGAKAKREELLEELEELERAHRAGDVGPKMYERARREIVDALARTLAVSSSTKGPA